MSLYKKDSNSNDIKVGVLQKVPIDEDYYIMEYIDLHEDLIYPFDIEEVDGDFKNIFKLKDTLIIQGNFGNYQGFLFGYYDEHVSRENNMAIEKKYNSVSKHDEVIWYLGPGEYCRIESERGLHIYGFHDGKPFYDNQSLDPDDENYTLNNSNLLYTNKSNDQYFAIGASKISRIIIHCSESKKTYSYYPCYHKDSKVIKIYEALTIGDFLTDTFTTAEYSKSVKYGVSIDDIKTITGSRYRDLMAIITEDSGVAISKNAHEPFIIKDSYDINHRFAFYLGLPNEINNVPVNNEYTVLGNDSSIYKPGDLILGRRPKWNIWANTMPYSIWIRPKYDYLGNDRDPDKLVYATYNLVHHWGKNGAVNLSNWVNYSYNEANPPKVEFLKKDSNDNYISIDYTADKIEIPYHNGYSCYCDIPLPGVWNDKESSSSKSSNSTRMFNNMLIKNNSIYMNHNIFPESAVRMKAGNLINWNMSQLQQYNEDPYRNQLVYGLCATLSHEFKTIRDTNLGLDQNLVTTNIVIGYRTAQTEDLQDNLPSNKRIDNGSLLVALSSDSLKSDDPTELTTTKKFKDGIIYENVRVSGNEPIRLYNEINSSMNNSGNHIYTIDAIGNLNLLRASRRLDLSETPLDTDLVYLTDFITSTRILIKGVFDLYEIDLSLLSSLASGNDVQFNTFENINSGNNLRFIFMNSNTSIVGYNSGEPIYSSKDLLAIEYDNVLNINSNQPLFFFPIGFEELNSSSSLASAGSYITSHYLLNNNHLYIPLVLTKKDLNSYESFLQNSSSDIQYDGTNISNLRIYVEALYCYDDNGEKLIKKDKFTKVLNKITPPSEVGSEDSVTPSIYENVFGYKKHVYDGWANYSLSDKGDINCRPCFWMIDISNEDLVNICPLDSNLDRANIPTDLTIKFWIQNEAISSSVLTYSGSFKYKSVNDSWYAPVIGESLYIFVKDLENNEWMNSAFQTDQKRIDGQAIHNDLICYYKQKVSHWFKGKMVNMFLITSEDPPLTLPSGGTYSSPLAELANGWSDAVPNPNPNLDEDPFTKLWMTERFYANTTNDRNNIAANIFTDLNWTAPIEIYEDDTTTQKPFFILDLRNGLEISNDDVENYVIYIEGDGYYGVKRDNVIQSVVSRNVLQNDGTYITRYEYVDGSNEIKYLDYEDYLRDFLVDSTSNSKYIGINPDDLSIWILSNEEIQTYENNVRVYDLDNGIYSIYNKYMFSIDSCLSPELERDKWITFDEFKLSTNRSSYNFMYHESTIFTIFGGEYHKVFEIILIGGEQNVENFYPVRIKDIHKLNSMLGNDYHLDRNYWYMIGGESYKWKVDSTWSLLNKNEILAPYKINGLNVSIYDILLYEINLPVFPSGNYPGYVTERECKLHITS